MTDWDRSEGRPEPQPRPGEAFAWLAVGVGLVAVLHGLVGLGMGALTLSADGAHSLGLPDVAQAMVLIPSAWLLGIGLFQGAYLVPAFAIAWLVRRPVALGIVVGAAITFLLNGACYGAVWFTFTRSM